MSWHIVMVLNGQSTECVSGCQDDPGFIDELSLGLRFGSNATSQVTQRKGNQIAAGRH